MAGAVRLYAGTRSGLEIVAVAGGNAESYGHAFANEIIQVVTGTSQRLLVGLADGVQLSSDGGSTWRRVLEGDIRSITVDPTDDSLVYAGTDPVHLYRSEDGGENWSELQSLQQLPEETHLRLGELTPSDMSHNTEPDFRHRRQQWWIHPPYKGHILHIFVHPEDHDLLILGIEHGGVALSTDRGVTWTDASDGIDYLDIHYVTNAPGGRDQYLLTSARGLFATNDPALGWQRAEKGCHHDYFHDLAVLPVTNGSLSLVAAAEGSPGVWRRAARGPNAAVYRSTDFGETWERVGLGGGLPDMMESMIWAFGRHPSEPTTVYAGLGVSSAVPSKERGRGTGSLMMTTDAGDSWATLLDGGAAVEHLFVTGA